MKGEYRKLRKKILLRVLVITVVVLALWAFLQFVMIDGILLSPIEQMPIGTEPPASETLELNDVQMALVSEMLRQRQDAYLATIGILLLVVVIFYYAMTRLTKYFKEVSAGVDMLLEEDTANISLSPEMDFMEAKLNGVKRELARRKEEARLAEQRKDELVAFLAHDIRTPLTTVMGYLNLLLEKPDMPLERRCEYLGITLESAHRLEALVNQFFEITRFNLQGIQLEIQEFDLAILLRQLAESFFPLLEPQDKRITVDAPEHLLMTGDADKLARVFRNILKNAATYSDDKTVIRVEAHSGEAGVTVRVADTGVRIPEEEQEAIFDKFHRLDHARSAKTGGAGLGLAIAKEVVQAHGGRICAGSEGRETVFTVTIPGGR